MPSADVDTRLRGYDKGSLLSSTLDLSLPPIRSRVHASDRCDYPIKLGTTQKGGIRTQASGPNNSSRLARIFASILPL